MLRVVRNSGSRFGGCLGAFCRSYYQRLRKRFNTYILVAFGSFMANLVVFNSLLGMHADPRLANGIAFVIGGQVNFLGHDYVTFRDQREDSHWAVRWLQFMPGNLIGFGINLIAASALIGLLLVPTWLMYLGAMVCSFLWNFTWNNYISHRERPRAQKQEADLVLSDVE